MRMILTLVSPKMYRLLKKEKQILLLKEKSKKRTSKRRITLYHASESLVRKLTK